MATVVTIPQDTRLRDQTRSLGAFFEKFNERRREEEEKERKRAAFQEALEGIKTLSSSEEPLQPQDIANIGESLIDAGMADKIPQFSEMLLNLKQEQAKQKTQQASREAAGLIGKGDVEGALATSGINLAQQSLIANAQAALRNKQQEKSKTDFNVFNLKTGQKRTLRVDPTLGGAELDALIPEGFGRDQPIAKAKPRQSTQTERDDQAILTLRGVPNTVKTRAQAANLRLGRKAVNTELANRFGGKIITDRFGDLQGLDFGGKEKERTQYGIAAGLVDDVLFAGVDPADAPNQIEEQARKLFTTGSFIPTGIRNQGPDAVAQFLQARRIAAPEIVQFYTDLTVVDSDPEAFRRVAEILNPSLSPAEIDAKVKEQFPNG